MKKTLLLFCFTLLIINSTVFAEDKTDSTTTTSTTDSITAATADKSTAPDKTVTDKTNVPDKSPQRPLLQAVGQLQKAILSAPVEALNDITSDYITPDKGNSQGKITTLTTAMRLPDPQGKGGMDLQKWAGPASVLTSDEIYHYGGYSPETALSYQEGISWADSNGFGLGEGLGPSINLRGIGGLTGSNSTLILLDGVRMNEMFDNATLLNSVPSNMVDHIEILRGGGSTTYGQGAFGGVINIVTKRPSKKIFDSQTEYVFGNYREQWLRTQMSGTVEKLGYVINLSRDLVGGYRQFSEDHEGNFYGKFFYPISDKTEVVTTIQKYRQTTHSPGNISNDQAEHDPHNHNAFTGTYFNEISSTAVDINHQLNDETQLSGKYYWRYRENNSNFGFGLFRITEQVNGGILQMTKKGALFGKPDTFVVGTELTGTVVRTGTEGSSPSHSQVFGAGFFIQNSIDLTSRWNFIQAFRYDFAQYNESLQSIAPFFTPFNGHLDFHGASPKLGTTWRPKDWISFFANYSRNFKAPAIQDIDAVLSEPGQPDFNDNPNVSDQTSNDFEIGFRSQPFKTVTLDGNLYWIPIHHEIMYDPVNFQNTNFNTLHKGLESKISWDCLKPVTVFATFTWNESTFAGGEFEGNPIPLTPRQIYTVGTRVKLPHNLMWSMRARSVNNYQRLNDFTDSANRRGDDYFVADMRLDIDRPKWAAYIEMYNAFNQHYSTVLSYDSFTGLRDNPMPERGVRFGVTLKLGV